MAEFNFTKLYSNKDALLNENKHIILEAYLTYKSKKNINSRLEMIFKSWCGIIIAIGDV